MRKLRVLIYKDVLLLMKDRAGLALLFIMPLALVFIMTMLQDNTYKAIRENRIPLAILDNDHDSLGIIITRELKHSDIFEVSLIQGGQEGEHTIRKEVSSGKYQLGIIIPDSITLKLRTSIRRSIALAFSGLPKQKAVSSDSSSVIILIDPTTKASFRSTVMSSMREFASRVEYGVTISEINKEIRRNMPFSGIDISLDRTISYEEQYARDDGNEIIPTSVQHNIPAWTLFAIFFIVISLSGNIIREREEGSFSRLLVMPCGYRNYIYSKVVTYLVICTVQFVLMLLMGIYILPLAGLPSFELGSQFAAMLLMFFSSALAAISYGIAIGTFATSHQQAANFGSVSVVVLAAVGGIWVPVFAMPPFMKAISVFSPMNWGIEGFYDVFIRGLGIHAIWPVMAALLVFSFVCMTVSVWYFHRRQRTK